MRIRRLVSDLHGDPAASRSFYEDVIRMELGIEVEDVDAVHAKAVDGGFEIVHPLSDEPWGVRRFFVRDPNGAVINVMQHVG
jgi:uncharacterized glyoxalase superfamily protein PhnB